MVDVFLNGRLIAKVDKKKAVELVKRLRELRRRGDLHPELTIAYIEERNEVRIDSRAGRVLRPLVVVKDGKPMLTEEDIKKLEKGEITWDDLLKQGKIEFLSADEEEEAFIALNEEELTPKHTHMELHPITLLGVPGSLIPYANYSRGDRVNYGTSKGVKQAVGIYAQNFLIRFDTFTNILHYPQEPIVKTVMHDIYGFHHHPAGQNFVVAMLSWEGYNMEDAIVMNRYSLERGLARSTYFRPYEAVEERYPGGQEDRIEIPSKDVRGYGMEEEYRNLDEDGIAFPEAWMNGGDVLIGRTSPPRFLGAVDVFRLGVEARRDTSIRVRRDEQGWVDTVIITENIDGRKLVKIKVRDDRMAEIGDKFSSRHGQKGVIGMIVPQEDMPFSAESGVVPDMLMNPEGIPSRMTFSHLMEFLTGKAGALAGKFVDGTPFEKDPLSWARKTLKAYGFKPTGKEVLVDGITGEEYKVEIFQGIIYYHKVRHMVANKIHARARGPVQILTKQPTEGRSKMGGLRMGEMEKDCLVAHGASLLLKERFSSDSVKIPVCTKCGVVAIYDHYKGKAYCPVCGGEEIEWIETSYAFYLLLNELISFHIYPKIVLRDRG